MEDEWDTDAWAWILETGLLDDDSNTDRDPQPSAPSFVQGVEQHQHTQQLHHIASTSPVLAVSRPTTAIVEQPLRKSCDFCRSRKKKCNGDGFNRCR